MGLPTATGRSQCLGVLLTMILSKAADLNNTVGEQEQGPTETGMAARSSEDSDRREGNTRSTDWDPGLGDLENEGHKKHW